jgi:hypothetical protein
VLNGVVARRARLLDATDCQPDYEAGIIDSLRDHVRRGDGVVVVGGGFGVSTVVAAQQTGPDGWVETYEASREHAELVQEAIEMNDVDDIADVGHVQVGDAVQTFGPINGATRIRPESIPPCDVLELDCEGAELEILSSIEMYPRVIIAESHGHLDAPSNVLHDALENAGYRVVSMQAEVPQKDVWVLTAVHRGER